MSRGRALLLGGVTVGVLDLLDAFVFFGRRGITPVQILHSIASGLLGRAAWRGGAPTAILGGLLHFFIAFSIVAIYHAASRRMPDLARRPWLWGPLYGAVAYVVMTWVVVPLSAAPFPPPHDPHQIANGLLIHLLGVGLPAALSARAAQPAAIASR